MFGRRPNASGTGGGRQEAARVVAPLSWDDECAPRFRAPCRAWRRARSSVPRPPELRVQPGRRADAQPCRAAGRLRRPRSRLRQASGDRGRPSAHHHPLCHARPSSCGLPNAPRLCRRPGGLPRRSRPGRARSVGLPHGAPRPWGEPQTRGGSAPASCRAVGIAPAGTWRPRRWTRTRPAPGLGLPGLASKPRSGPGTTGPAGLPGRPNGLPSLPGLRPAVAGSRCAPRGPPGALSGSAGPMVGVAQSVRAPDCGSGGRRFESGRPPLRRQGS